MDSIRIAKSRFLKDNPHLMGEIDRKETPRWIENCISKGEIFIPHFYASLKDIQNASMEKGRPIILDMEKSSIRHHLSKLLEEIRILFPDAKETICLNAEFMDTDSKVCDIRVYRYQSSLTPCIPPLPSFRIFNSQKVEIELDQLVCRMVHIHDVREKEAFLSLIFFLIENNGREFNYRKTASLLNLRFETLKTFLGYLERAFFVRIIESRSQSPKSNRISLITDWRLVNFLMDRQPIEIFLSPVDSAAVLSYRFLNMLANGQEVYLEDLMDREGETPPTSQGV